MTARIRAWLLIPLVGLAMACGPTAHTSTTATTDPNDYGALLTPAQATLAAQGWASGYATAAKSDRIRIDHFLAGPLALNLTPLIQQGDYQPPALQVTGVLVPAQHAYPLQFWARVTEGSADHLVFLEQTSSTQPWLAYWDAQPYSPLKFDVDPQGYVGFIPEGKGSGGITAKSLTAAIGDPLNKMTGGGESTTIGSPARLQAHYGPLGDKLKADQQAAAAFQAATGGLGPPILYGVFDDTLFPEQAGLYGLQTGHLLGVVELELADGRDPPKGQPCVTTTTATPLWDVTAPPGKYKLIAAGGPIFVLVDVVPQGAQRTATITGETLWHDYPGGLLTRPCPQ